MTSIQFSKNSKETLFCGESDKFQRLSKNVGLLLWWPWRYSMKRKSNFSGWSEISTLVDLYTSIFLIWKTFAQIFNQLKIQNVSHFKSCQKTLSYHFLKGLLFCNGWPINMNVSTFWETPVGFLESPVL